MATLTINIQTKENKASKDQMVLRLAASYNPHLTMNVIVDSFEHASAIQRAYLDLFGFGGSMFVGGALSNKHHVSFNGRVWVGKIGSWDENSKEVTLNKELVATYYKEYFTLLQVKFDY